MSFEETTACSDALTHPQDDRLVRSLAATFPSLRSVGDRLQESEATALLECRNELTAPLSYVDRRRP